MFIFVLVVHNTYQKGCNRANGGNEIIICEKVNTKSKILNTLKFPYLVHAHMIDHYLHLVEAKYIVIIIIYIYLCIYLLTCMYVCSFLFLTILFCNYVLFYYLVIITYVLN